MKKTTLMLLILILTTATNAIVIKQVLYDPINTESGGEAIEIFNEQNEEINLTGWYIKTEKSEKDFTFPPTILLPGQSFLIADESWHEEKDNKDWKNADAEESITLYNKDSGVALFNNNNNLVDAVGWGSTNNSQLYKHTPAKQVKEGNSLMRIKYTGNNKEDFIESPPNFFANELAIQISVEQEKNIEKIEIEDEDKEKDGIQISNEKSKNITIKVQLFKNYSNDVFISFENKIILCQIKTNFCEAKIEIKKEFEAKHYEIEIKAGNQLEQKTIEILPRKGFFLDKNNLKISAKKGEEINQNITIKNTGNANQHIKLKTNLIDEQINNILYSENKNQFRPIDETAIVNLPFSNEKIIFFKIKISDKTKEGTYRGKILFEVI